MYLGTALALVERDYLFPVTGCRIQEALIAENIYECTPGAGHWAISVVTERSPESGLKEKETG